MQITTMRMWILLAIGIGIAVASLFVTYRGDVGSRNRRASNSWTSASVVMTNKDDIARREEPKQSAFANGANDKSAKFVADARSSGAHRQLDQTVQGRITDARQADTEPPDKYELEDARTAVGRSFPVSPSIERECIRASRPRPMCLGTLEILAKFTKETRNISWARSQERQLEAAINALGPDKFLIRAIECRSTLCAVEVAGDSIYVGDLEEDSDFEKNFIASDSTFAFETGPSGERIVVTLMTFEPR